MFSDNKKPRTMNEIGGQPNRIEKNTKIKGDIISEADFRIDGKLDGNVKRVLSRFYAVEGWPGNKAVEQLLWQHSQACTPKTRSADYTQAVMDLGATCCTRTNPKCKVCPVNDDCLALANNQQHELPDKKPKKKIPERSTFMLVLQNQQHDLLMQRRPNHGIWGGLWSFPEFDSQEDLTNWCLRVFNETLNSETVMKTLTHAFSHFRLYITPISVRCNTPIHWVMEDDDWVWYKHGTSQAGLAAPVKQLIKLIAK